jgi:hypothetical protein
VTLTGAAELVVAGCTFDRAALAASGAALVVLFGARVDTAAVS